MWRTSRDGPTHHPACHPVTENVFPADESVTVRSNISGS